MRHVYCFDSKVAVRPLTFNNGAILLRGDYGTVVKQEITIGEVPQKILTLTSIIVPSFNFVLKKL